VNSRSLTFRLIAWYCGLLFLAGSSFVIYSYISFADHLRSTKRAALATRADDIANLGEPLLTDPAALSAALEKRFAPEAHDRFMRISLDERLVYLSGPPAEGTFSPAAIDRPPSGTPVLRPVGKLWIYSMQRRLGGGHILSVEAGELGNTMAGEMQGLVYTLLIGLPALLCIAALGGYWLVRHSLKPVADMINAAEALTFNSPRKRLPLAGTGDVLDELGRTLNRMLNRLDSAYQHASRFSADAAHELRTPLAIVRGELEFIAPRSELAPEVSAAAGSALDETLRLGRLIENLLTLTVIEGVGGKRAHWPVDLQELGIEIIDQMRLLAEEKQIALVCTVHPSVYALGDRDRLKQALVNLLDNAIKYTHAGGRITVEVARRGEHALLSVADSGIGIAQEHQSSIFDRFFRIDPDRGTDGAGLGLAIVKSICVAHGGSIAVKSMLNEGSTFTIELPLAPTVSSTTEKPV
jgi:signal transduction histidine kinase